jgi:hypothetical protein
VDRWVARERTRDSRRASRGASSTSGASPRHSVAADTPGRSFSHRSSSARAQAAPPISTVASGRGRRLRPRRLSGFRDREQHHHSDQGWLTFAQRQWNGFLEPSLIIGVTAVSRRAGAHDTRYPGSIGSATPAYCRITETRHGFTLRKRARPREPYYADRDRPGQRETLSGRRSRRGSASCTSCEVLRLHAESSAAAAVGG